MAGANGQRRTRVEQEFAMHADEVAKAVADQFRPVYERVLQRAKDAEERAAILQTAVERVALGKNVSDAQALCAQVLDQLGIVPDVQTDGDHAQTEA